MDMAAVSGMDEVCSLLIDCFVCSNCGNHANHTKQRSLKVSAVMW
jgi:hypothetical protein